MKYEQAIKIAESYRENLLPYCKRIDIAGSVRRERPLAGDIELLLMPDLSQVGEPVSVDLFETVTIPKLFEVLKRMGDGTHKCEPDSRQVKILLPQDIMLDIYIPQAHDYFRQLAIRTGNWVYARNVIAAGWVRCGWVGTRDGLRRRDQCHKVGNKWVTFAPSPELPPVWESEEAFFKFIDAPFISPVLRQMESPFPIPSPEQDSGEE